MAGDLNFRINDILLDNVFKDIVTSAKEHDYSKLVAKDELTLARQSHTVLLLSGSHLDLS